MRTVRWSRTWVLRVLAATVATAVLGPLAYKLATANLGTVRPGHVYRSGQMRAGSLARLIRERGIRTVLNLRGANPDEAWYRAEREATNALGATQIDVAMSSCEWMSRVQARAIVAALDRCEYPLLIHCWHGSERTGLVSAFTELLRPGGSLESARSQFSLRHLFVPTGDGIIMPRHLDQYEAWLAGRGSGHSPGRFRRWIDEGFRPGRPSREDWPYDPYPLTVVTRPEPAVAGRLAGAEGPRAGRR